MAQSSSSQVQDSHLPSACCQKGSECHYEEAQRGHGQCTRLLPAPMRLHTLPVSWVITKGGKAVPEDELPEPSWSLPQKDADRLQGLTAAEAEVDNECIPFCEVRRQVKVRLAAAAQAGSHVDGSCTFCWQARRRRLAACRRSASTETPAMG